jgi:hypothetical protein
MNEGMNELGVCEWIMSALATSIFTAETNAV